MSEPGAAPPKDEAADARVEAARLAGKRGPAAFAWFRVKAAWRHRRRNVPRLFIAFLAAWLRGGDDRPPVLIRGLRADELVESARPWLVPNVPRFNERENEIIRLTIEGHSVAEIAEATGLSRNAVNNYGASIRAKVKSRRDFDAYIVRESSNEPLGIRQSIRGVFHANRDRRGRTGPPDAQGAH
jgi:DNA-binding CsgD family transcriptional regulator